MSDSTEHPLPPKLLAHVRQLAPKRTLTYSDSLNVARHQASALRELLGVTEPAMPLGWITQVPKLKVEVVPAYKLGENTSGLTTRKDGGYLILINKNRPRSHRRFTLCHELKHAIDYPYSKILHAGLGHGDPEAQEYWIKKIADEFAAHLLMPTMLMKRAFHRGLQDPRLLAQAFETSEEATRIRMDNLGMTDDGEQPVATYFRRSSLRFGDGTLAA